MTENENKEPARGPRGTDPAADKAAGRPLRGLYDRVNIPVKTLNIVIIVLAAALVLCMGIGIANRGFTVSFNSLGGTAVESQKRCRMKLCRT